MDLPLQVTTPYVDYEPYWKRKCQDKWQLTDPAQYGVDLKNDDDDDDDIRRREQEAEGALSRGKSAMSENRRSLRSGVSKATARSATGAKSLATNASVRNTNATNGFRDTTATTGNSGHIKATTGKLRNTTATGVSGNPETTINVNAVGSGNRVTMATNGAVPGKTKKKDGAGGGGGGAATDDSTAGRRGSYKTAFFERTLAEKIEQFIPHDEATSVERTQDLAEFLTHAKLVVRKLKIEQLYGSRPVVPADEWEKNEEEEEEEDEEKKREAEEAAMRIDYGGGIQAAPPRDFFEHLRGERMDHIDLLPVLMELPLIKSLDICYR